MQLDSGALDEGVKYFVLRENRRIGYILDGELFDKYDRSVGYVTDKGELFSTVVESLTDEEIGVIGKIESSTQVRSSNDSIVQLMRDDDPLFVRTRPARGDSSKGLI